MLFGSNHLRVQWGGVSPAGQTPTFSADLRVVSYNANEKATEASLAKHEKEEVFSEGHVLQEAMMTMSKTEPISSPSYSSD